MKISFPFLLSGMLAAACPVAHGQDSSAIFHLGEIVVKASRADSFSLVSRENMARFQRLNVAKALDLLPGVTLGNVGPRNESIVYIRGFNLRQVPVFVDGIPVYVPYDGYVDLARFTTFDLSRITVSKGNASVLYGPNTMGGAINLVSVQPVHKLDVEAGAGWMNGGYEGYINAGSRWKKFYLQTGASIYDRDYFNLPDNYAATKTEDGGKRDNAYNKDIKLNIKLGYTPNQRSEYAIGYIDQQGEKGTPVYAGQDTLNSLLKSPRFWTWPYWNKRSLYFLANIQPDSASYIKLRAYYDQFRNQLNSYDDATYTTQTRPFAFTSFYDDHSIGANAEYGRGIFRGNTLRTALHFKRDVHKENNAGEPVREMTDNTFSWSVSDEHRFSAKWAAQAGVGWNFRENEKAEDYNSQTQTVSTFRPGSNTAWNVQASLSHFLSSTRTLQASVGRMTRLATIKDRYSYRMGTAIPNPDLKAENAAHYELTYNDAGFRRLHLQASLFYSRIRDVIQRVNNIEYDTTADRWLSQMQNQGRAAFYGGEVAVDYQVARGLHTSVQYSFIRRKNLDNKDIYFTDVPEHKLAGIAMYDIKKAAFTLHGEYNTSRISTTYGTAVPSFFLLHGTAAVNIRPWVKLSVGVNNIFDTDYALVEGYPEQGRNYFVKLNFNYFIL